jgi:hypothetical protein
VIEPPGPFDGRTRLFPVGPYPIRPRQRRTAPALREKAASDILIVARGSRPQKITSFGDVPNADRL